MGDVDVEDNLVVSKKIIYLILTLVLIVIAGFFFMSFNDDGNINNEYLDDSVSGDAQNVVLGFKNYNYYPNTITVKAGQPVRISLDSSVSGCYRSFTIRDFGISKNLRTPNDYVEFTPTKKGTYRFSCSMGMGTGTLVVE